MIEGKGSSFQLIYRVLKKNVEINLCSRQDQLYHFI